MNIIIQYEKQLQFPGNKSFGGWSFLKKQIKEMQIWAKPLYVMHDNIQTASHTRYSLSC